VITNGMGMNNQSKKYRLNFNTLYYNYKTGFFENNGATMQV